MNIMLFWENIPYVKFSYLKLKQINKKYTCRVNILCTYTESI